MGEVRVHNFAAVQQPRSVIRDVEIWCGNPQSLRFQRCDGFMDSGAEVGVANQRHYSHLLVNHRPLAKPACLRLLNGERVEILKTADLVIKLRKGGREYDLGRVEVQVIDEEGWKDVVIGEDTLRRLGWMPDQIAFPVFPNTPTPLN